MNQKSDLNSSKEVKIPSDKLINLPKSSQKIESWNYLYRNYSLLLHDYLGHNSHYSWKKK